MNVLLPVSRKRSPARTARVATAAMSEPVPGSVMPSAHTVSPAMIPGRYARFCASVPKRVSHGEDMSVCTRTENATPPDRHRAISSPRTMLERKSPPAPPYSAGNSRPRRPSAPSRRQKAFGTRPASSHPSISGTTSLSTKARIVLRSSSCSSLNGGEVIERSWPAAEASGEGEALRVAHLRPHVRLHVGEDLADVVPIVVHPLVQHIAHAEIADLRVPSTALEGARVEA